jgi:two-component system response regulator RegA
VADANAPEDGLAQLDGHARRDHPIERAFLTDCGGNVSQAARTLGIHRRSLQRKLSKSPVPR